MNPWPSVGRMAMLRESSLGKTIVVLSLFLGPVGRRHVCSVAWRPHGLRIISSIVRNRDEVFGWFGTDRRGCSKRSGTAFRNVFRNKTEIFTALRPFGKPLAGIVSVIFGGTRWQGQKVDTDKFSQHEKFSVLDWKLSNEQQDLPCARNQHRCRNCKAERNAWKQRQRQATS